MNWYKPIEIDLKSEYAVPSENSHFLPGIRRSFCSHEEAIRLRSIKTLATLTATRPALIKLDSVHYVCISSSPITS